MQDITFDYLQLLYPHRSPSELTMYIESHLPKVKYNNDSENFLHWHTGVSHLDPRTGNRLISVPNIQRENAARQSAICAKYGLDDPITYINWDTPRPSKKLSARGKIVEALATQFESNPPDNYEEILDVIDQYNEHHDVQLRVFREGSGKNKYLTLKTNIKDMDSIRLNGPKFRCLEPVYSDKYNLDINTEGYKTRREQLKADLERIRDDEKFRESFLKKSHQRFIKHGKNSEYKKNDPTQLTESAAAWRKSDYYIKEIEQFLSETSNTQRAFYRLYSVSLRADVLGDSKCFIDRETKHRVIWQPEHKVRLVDSGSKITTDNLNSEAKRLAAVHLMLEMAEAKGWPLESLNFTGDPEFLEVAERERAKRVSELVAGKKVVRSLPDCETGKQVVIKTNPTDKFTQPPHSKELITKTKAQIERLKRDVDQRLVIELLAVKGVSVSNVTTNKKRHTLFVIKGKRFNGFDALTSLEAIN